MHVPMVSCQDCCWPYHLVMASRSGQDNPHTISFRAWHMRSCMCSIPVPPTWPQVSPALGMMMSFAKVSACIISSPSCLQLHGQSAFGCEANNSFHLELLMLVSVRPLEIASSLSPWGCSWCMRTTEISIRFLVEIH